MEKGVSFFICLSSPGLRCMCLSILLQTLAEAPAIFQALTVRLSAFTPVSPTVAFSLTAFLLTCIEIEFCIVFRMSLEMAFLEFQDNIVSILSNELKHEFSFLALTASLELTYVLVFFNMQVFPSAVLIVPSLLHISYCMTEAAQSVNNMVRCSH